MRIAVRPLLDPQSELDVTRCVVAAIAQELWRRYGGNDRLNWLEAELHVQRFAAELCRPSTVPPLVADARARDLALCERLQRKSIARGVPRERARARPGQSAGRPSAVRPHARTMQRSHA
jgi:hypothetical protein